MVNIQFKFVVLVLTSLFSASCSLFTQLPDYSIDAEQAQTAVNNYMECDECSNHQLFHVRLAGDEAKRILDELIVTPENAIDSGFEHRLATRYDTLKYKHPKLNISRGDFIAAHRTAKKNRVKARAAIAIRLLDEPSISLRDMKRIRRVE